MSDWVVLESSYGIDENHIPDSVTLNAVFDSRGTVWVKDVELLYLPAPGVVPKAEQWGQLFNGKNLDGWIVDDAENWKVQDRELLGTGLNSYIVTKKRDYHDFHLRVEMKLGRGDGCGIVFRGTAGDDFAFEALVSGFDDGVTGALLHGGDPVQGTLVNKPPPTPPDTPIVLEVIAQSSRIEIKVNGQTTIRTSDVLHRDRDRAQPITLKSRERGTSLRFQKIEIKELPPTKLDPAVVQPLREVIVAKERIRNTAKIQVDIGKVGTLDLIAAEIDLIEARLRLAEVEQDKPDVVALLAELVAQRQEERRLIGLRVEIGTEAPSELDKADARLAEAKARLAKVRPLPDAAQVPFDKTKAEKHQKEWADYLGEKVEFANKIGMTLRVIPPGDFQMGAKDDEVKPDITKAEENKNPGWQLLIRSLRAEMPQHPVRITRPFAIGKYEVTVGQFKKFVEATGYKTTAEQVGGYGVKDGAVVWGKDYSWKNVGYQQADLAPVWNVSRDDAVEFCKWLSKEDGRTCRLPTEAEWEWACRAGTDTRTFWNGTRPADALPYAWGGGKTGHQPQPGGQLKPNAFGLYDMNGNVWEWCDEWFSETYYKDSPTADPPGPSDPEGGKTTRHRVQRGGGVNGGNFGMSSTARSVHDQEVVGFRVVCEIARDVQLPPPEGKKTPVNPVVAERRKDVAERIRVVDTTKQALAAGRASKLALLTTEVELTEAWIRLAEEVQNPAAVIDLFEELVAQRQEERDLIAVRVKAGTDAPPLLSAADARLADAKARLAKAKKPEPPPSPPAPAIAKPGKKE